METTTRRRKPAKPFRIGVWVSGDCKSLLGSIRTIHGISEGAAIELGVRAYAAVNGINLAQASQPASEGE